MTSLEDRLLEPIIAHVGAGGVKLGDSREDVENLLGTPHAFRGTLDTEVLEYPGLIIGVDGGRVFLISAIEGYRGHTSAGLTPGDSWNALIMAVPDLVFDDDERVWRAAASDGFVYEVERPPRPEEQIGGDLSWVSEEHVALDPERAKLTSITVRQALTVER